MLFLLKLIMTNRAPFFILNTIRALNILSILAAILASVTLLLKTANLTSKIGYFNIFDLIEKVFIILFAIFILLTEAPILPILSRLFESQCPCFAKRGGFLVLSGCLAFIGCDTLSYLAKAQTDEKTLGGDFYRMVQAAGCMCIIMAMVNVPATFVFKVRKAGLSARQVRGLKKEKPEQWAQEV